MRKSTHLGNKNIEIHAAYPTIEHERAAVATQNFFSGRDGVEAVNLTCSCARGKASLDSCVDIAVWMAPDLTSDDRSALEQQWRDFHKSERVFQQLDEVGKFSFVDLDFVDGQFSIPPHGWTSGPDEFELEIGNYLVYTVPLWQRGDYFERLRSQWLPYYDEALRQKRLEMVRGYCLNNLDHIPLYVNRGLHFQAFRRLYNAFGEFLQALFIARRTYPIAYDKWIREQVEEILGMPELYRQLPKFFEIESFESQEIAKKASVLEHLLNEYAFNA